MISIKIKVKAVLTIRSDYEDQKQTDEQWKLNIQSEIKDK